MALDDMEAGKGIPGRWNIMRKRGQERRGLVLPMIFGVAKALALKAEVAKEEKVFGRAGRNKAIRMRIKPKRK